MVGPPGFEPGSIAPLESIVAGVAREVRGCLVHGEGARVDVLLPLLAALGSEPACPQRTLTIDWFILPSGPVTPPPTGRPPSLMASLT